MFYEAEKIYIIFNCYMRVECPCIHINPKCTRESKNLTKGNKTGQSNCDILIEAQHYVKTRTGKFALIAANICRTYI